MHKNISPAAIAVVIVVALAIIGIVYYQQMNRDPYDTPETRKIMADYLGNRQKPAGGAKPSPAPEKPSGKPGDKP